MVSRRNYFSIVIMMAVLFFMFQFSQVIKESGNTYDENEFVIEESLLETGDAGWQPVTDQEQLASGDFVLFIGNQEEQLGNMISQWCNYTKRNLLCKEGVKDFKLSLDKLPELILVDSAAVNWESEVTALEALTIWKVPIVFCNLPDASIIDDSPMLQKMLGIKQVVAKETPVLGIRLFDGFLIGGEAVYMAETEEEKKRQDLDLTVPWYVPASGTKTYMVGMLNEKQLDRELFPCLIWRNTYGNTKIFAVEGEYLSTLAGLGILDAFVYELNEYTLYPIINAQNTLVANFPGFSDENSGQIMEIYSRSPQMVFQDVMWPSISAMTETNDLKLTCFFSPQYDYRDGLEPYGDRVIFYLQQLKELGSEAGMAVKYSEEVSLDEVLQRDEVFYDSLNSQYVYQTLYLEEADVDRVASRAGYTGLLKNVKSISCSYSPEHDLVYYLNNKVTVQSATGEARENTYMDHLTDRSLWSALGYSNVVLDLHDAVWPKDTQDQWEHLYDTMSSNIQSYWTAQKAFDQTTLSESDRRVRTFLNLDYEVAREGDRIVLKIGNTQQESWFILRTHGEKVREIQGGTYEKLEDDVYLIHATRQQVEIKVEAINSPVRGRDD